MLIYCLILILEMNRNIKTFIKKITPFTIRKFRNYLLLQKIKKKEKASISMSQAGQDFWVYGEVFNEMKNGIFLDIGAHNGVDLSNTYILEKRYDWNGICVEGNPKTFTDLKSNRNCRCINKCVDKQSGSVKFALDGVMGGIVDSDCDNTSDKGRNTIEVNAIQLLELLKEENAPQIIDYLSIDIEGAEDRALLKFNFKEYTFNCITIERPSQGLREVLSRNGYILIKEIPGLDCHYIHSSFIDKYKSNLLDFGEKKFLTKRWK